MKRAPKHIVDCHLGEIEMSAGEWRRYVNAGLLRIIRGKVARPARNVVVWLEDKKLRLLHAYFIYTSWLAIERSSTKRELAAEEFDKIHCGLRIERWGVVTEVVLNGIPSNS